MRRIYVAFITSPPRLDHARMYANHYAYNNLIAFLEKPARGWPADIALTDGKRIVDGMSEAFFQWTLATWTALNDKYIIGELFAFHFLTL